jgi:hypothetical protein
MQELMHFSEGMNAWYENKENIRLFSHDNVIHLKSETLSKSNLEGFYK